MQAGGAAGTTTDVALFPLDTIKTRLQSNKGFLSAGGFARMYAGLLPAILGSAPSGKDTLLDIKTCTDLSCLSCHLFLYI